MPTDDFAALVGSGNTDFVDFVEASFCQEGKAMSSSSTWTSAFTTPLSSPCPTSSDRVVGEDWTAEYIIYLEPPSGGQLGSFLAEKRLRIRSELGSDPTNQYHPHCSLTGFIKVVSSDAMPSKSEVEDILARSVAETLLPFLTDTTLASYNAPQFCVTFGSSADCGPNESRSLIARNGSLVVPLTCAWVRSRLDALCYRLHTELGAALPECEEHSNSSFCFAKHTSMLTESTVCSVEEGEASVSGPAPSRMSIRKKRADHVSLASSRTSRELELLYDFFSEVERVAVGATWDLVVYERIEKGKEGAPHRFREVQRFHGVGVCGS